MVDLDHALDIAKKAAHLAGERIKAGFEEDLEVEVKSDPVDRVTHVDKECEKIVLETISQAFPNHEFLGEEGVGCSSGTEGARWIVDPIDGTSNFIRRLPHCGVSIGLEVEGEPTIGVIYFPIFGDTYWAVKEKGAFKNDKKIHVHDCKDIKDASIAEIYSDRKSRGKEVLYPPSLLYRKFGSSITALSYIADGKIDGTAHICYRWDIAAAEVIIPEAGGRLEWEYLGEEDNGRGSIRVIASTPGIFDAFSSLVESIDP
jgi:myo-inositol-1(or 4)-monophosphatase